MYDSQSQIWRSSYLRKELPINLSIHGQYLIIGRDPHLLSALQDLPKALRIESRKPARVSRGNRRSGLEGCDIPL
jgi:hypothetical protein